MLLYNVNYRDAKTGRTLRDQDIAMPFFRRAPKGLIADCTCVNGSQDESYSVDDQGRIVSVAKQS